MQWIGVTEFREVLEPDANIRLLADQRCQLLRRSYHAFPFFAHGYVHRT